MAAHGMAGRAMPHAVGGSDERPSTHDPGAGGRRSDSSATRGRCDAVRARTLERESPPRSGDAAEIGEREGYAPRIVTTREETAEAREACPLASRRPRSRGKERTKKTARGRSPGPPRYAGFNFSPSSSPSSSRLSSSQPWISPCNSTPRRRASGLYHLWRRISMPICTAGRSSASLAGSIDALSTRVRATPSEESSIVSRDPIARRARARSDGSPRTRDAGDPSTTRATDSHPGIARAKK